MTTLQEKITIMQAHANGKVIEYRTIQREHWMGCSSPVWNWSDCEYRVKKEKVIRWSYFNTRTQLLFPVTADSLNGLYDIYRRTPNDCVPISFEVEI